MLNEMASSKLCTCNFINLKKAKVPTEELNKHLCDVSFITEPYTARGKVAGLRKTNCKILFAQGVKIPRAALRVKEGLTPWLVEEFTDADMCTAAIKLNGIATYVCCLLYTSPSPRDATLSRMPSSA